MSGGVSSRSAVLKLGKVFYLDIAYILSLKT